MAGCGAEVHGIKTGRGAAGAGTTGGVGGGSSGIARIFHVTSCSIDLCVPSHVTYTPCCAAAVAACCCCCCWHCCGTVTLI